MRTGDDPVVLVTLAAEIHVKAPRTRNRFRRKVADNLRAACARRRIQAEVDDLDIGRLTATGPDLDAVANAAADTFGVHKVERAVPVAFDDLEELGAKVADIAGDLVANRTFAVRARRHGAPGFTSVEVGQVLGRHLLDRSAGVDLDDPQVEVHVVVMDGRAWVVDRHWDGPGGLPLDTQDKVLSLLSGGFDSPVATWMMMRRGCPIDLVHVRLDCAQTDHAVAVAHELWRRWGAATSPVVSIVDFEAVEEALLDQVKPRLRQVILKQLMFRAADLVADEVGATAVVTGEAVGQVSSQTLHHLAEIDRACEHLVLRPLGGMDKQEIIGWSRRIGTHDLSARAREVCNLAAGNRVAVAARGHELDRVRGELPEGLVAEAVANRQLIALEHWFPGVEGPRLAEVPPPGAKLVRPGDEVPDQGALAFAGQGAVHRATRAVVAGREAVVLRRRGPVAAAQEA